MKKKDELEKLFEDSKLNEEKSLKIQGGAGTTYYYGPPSKSKEIPTTYDQGELFLD